MAHLHNLMYLAIQHELSSFRECHAAVLLVIEQGHSHRGDSLIHLEYHSMRVKQRSMVVQCASSTPVVPFCCDFQRNHCKLTKDHCSTIHGEQKWLQHACPKCWFMSRQITHHTKFLPDSPLLPGSPDPRETPKSTS